MKYKISLNLLIFIFLIYFSAKYIILKDEEAAGKVNELLHEYREYVVGRMGIPYRDRGISIISVVIDAPQDATSSLSGKLGMIHGVTAKTLTAKL